MNTSAVDLFVDEAVLPDEGCQCGGKCCPGDFVPGGIGCDFGEAYQFERPAEPVRYVGFSRLPAHYPFGPRDDPRAATARFLLALARDGPPEEESGPGDRRIIIFLTPYLVRTAGRLVRYTGPDDRWNLAATGPTLVVPA